MVLSDLNEAGNHHQKFQKRYLPIRHGTRLLPALTDVRLCLADLPGRNASLGSGC